MRYKFFAIKLQKGIDMILNAWLVALSKFFSINSINSIKLQKGVTMIEYALIAALVAVIAIGAINTVGTRLNIKFSNIAKNLK